MARARIVVGLARVSNCYGGPEEGGWYYEAGEPVGRARSFFNVSKAYAYRDFLAEKIEMAEKFSGVGVGGCGDDDGLVRGEVFGDGLRAVVQHLPTESWGGLENWPAYTPEYS